LLRSLEPFWCGGYKAGICVLCGAADASNLAIAGCNGDE
jgi:hypothetical protein